MEGEMYIIIYGGGGDSISIQALSNVQYMLSNVLSRSHYMYVCTNFYMLHKFDILRMCIASTYKEETLS
jgi:hypothetical protein